MKRRPLNLSIKTYTEDKNRWKTKDLFTRNMLNSYSVLVPDSEHFIIRTVKKYQNSIPEKLRKDVRMLFYQEGQHARETTKLLKWIDKYYRTKLFAKISHIVTYMWIEKVFPNKLLLATSAAIEHINATTSGYFLTHEKIFDQCPKNIKAIFYWHFAEEIEHKSVVYDVLENKSKSRLLRIGGMVFAAFGFMLLLIIGSFVLSIQDGSLMKRSFWQGFTSFLFKKDGLLRIWIKNTKLYCSKNFHPKHIDNSHLVDKAIEIFHKLKA